MDFNKIDVESLKETIIEPPSNLIATFNEVRSTESTSTAWTIDNFNDIGQHIDRDTSCKVQDNEDLIEKVNKYDYNDPAWIAIAGGVECCVGWPIFAWFNRYHHVTPPAYFGHYECNGKHYLIEPGRHVYYKYAEHWIEDVEIDDETKLVRSFGSKTIVNITQGYLGGAYRLYKSRRSIISNENGLDVPNQRTTETGEYVIFGVGRHVIPQEQYRNIEVVKLESKPGQVGNGDIIKLGPLTILYIKEGYLGGAFVKNEGVYKIFPPGPPYILHEQNYENITCVKRTLDIFKVGPFTFVNVKDGEIGGAFNKNNATYQIFTPGNTYKLHEKDYADSTVIKRSGCFDLGPYHYITAVVGNVTGSQNRTTGDFVVFPPGATYKLNSKDYDPPITVPKDKNLVKIGPLVFLTVQKGRLAGAFKVDTGVFEEFEEGKEYILHNKTYRNIVEIQKYTYDVQQFGPNIVVTIADGFDGVFEKEGKLEVCGPGFYKMSAEYKQRDKVPHQPITSLLKNLTFKTKDGIEMSTNITLVWKVVDPIMVVKYTNCFKGVQEDLLDRTSTNLERMCSLHNRAELLPTQQDIVVQHEGESLNQQEIEIYLQKSKDKMLTLYEKTQRDCFELIQASCKTSNWGIELISLQIDNMILHDKEIIDNLSKMTQAILATKVQDASRKAEVNKAEADKLVAITRASAESEVAKQKAQNAADIELMKAQTEAKSKAEQYRIQKEMEKQMAETDAEIRKINAETAFMEQKRKAEAEIVSAEASARAIELKNQAESKMPEQQYNLELAKIHSEALKGIGNAAWRYPDAMTAFMNQVMPNMNLSMKPLPASEALQMMQNDHRETHNN